MKLLIKGFTGAIVMILCTLLFWHITTVNSRDYELRTITDVGFQQTQILMKQELQSGEYLPIYSNETYKRTFEENVKQLVSLINADDLVFEYGNVDWTTGTLEVKVSTTYTSVNREREAWKVRRESIGSYYVVSYALNSGHLEDGRTQDLYQNTIELPTPIYADHEFLGWYLEPSFVTRVTSLTKITGTVYAKWAGQVTVTYVLDGGTLPPGTSNSGQQGESFALPVPYKDGQAFIGWFTRESGGVQLNDTITLTSDITVYARWEPNYFVIDYDANGGQNAPETQLKARGYAATLSSQVPTYTLSTHTYSITFEENGGSTCQDTEATYFDGFRFINWNTKRGGSGTTYNSGASYSEDADITLYAQWRRVTENLPINLPTPTRLGHKFDGWFTDEGLTDRINTTTYTATADTTLYAKWTPITYVIRYNSNGGRGTMGDQTIAYSVAGRLAKNLFTYFGE